MSNHRFAPAHAPASRIPYETDEVDALQQVQLFLTDPAGIGVEPTFTDPQYQAR